jgi:hypothetical protein
MASAGLILACQGAASLAQDSNYRPQNQQIPPPACYTAMEKWEDLRAGAVPAPCTQQTHDEWLKDVRHWREERRIRIGYDDARYRMPEMKWAQSSFIQPQTMVQDRYLYDPVQHKYTVDRYLDDLQKRYGSVDSVLIWATYPIWGSTTATSMIWCVPCRAVWKASNRWSPIFIAAACG